MIVMAESSNENRFSQGKVSEDDYLQRSQHLILVVTAEAALVKTFIGKWNIIRNKLKLFPAQFTDLADFPDFLQNALCKELLESIFSTLTETQDLVKKCVDVEPGIGKLQMQSSLDGLAMKLNQHLQDCELLIKSGVLRESVIPRMPARSRTISNREAVRCTSRDLLARLQIGNFESRQKALDSLLALMQEDDKNVLIVAGQGSVPVLVHLLDSNFLEIREKAAAAVCKLAQADSCEHLLVTEGVLAPLVRLLESGSSLAKEKASSALQALSFTPENARSIGTHCGVSALVEICQIGTPAAQAAAAGTLRNLASIAEIKQNFIDENAIPVLIRLATSGTALAQEHAVDCLQNLASDDYNLKTLIVREGGIHPLLIFWDAAATPRAQEIAIGALKNLSSCKAHSGALISAGFIPRLVNAIKSGIPTVQQIAAVAIYELASSMENRKALGEAGCIPALVKMFEAKTTAEQEAAAQALSALLLFDSNRKVFRREEKGVSGTVQLLDPSSLNTDKKYPISILLSLSNNAKCKKQMVAAGACIYLEKLAEMEVGDAKKLLECLERGNLWNFFGRT
eukprot:Gb_09425 [translate_table: standard]